MKLTEKEIKEQKKEHGAEVVNYFVRFMEARENWKALPEYFIKQVKRKVLHQLANRKTKDSTRKTDDS